MKTPRISPETLKVLAALVERPSAWRYGYDLARETGLKSGTLYPILIRLAKNSLLESEWVLNEGGVPPRHTYRLTPSGLELARAKLAAARIGRRGYRPALISTRA